MNRLSFNKAILILILLISAFNTCDAQLFKRNAPKKAERTLFKKSKGIKEDKKVREPRKVTEAKRKQERNLKKRDKDYGEAVKKTRQNSIDIQTPEVQERMKQNQKNAKLRDKEKKKKANSKTRGGRRKYN